jgi:hypothetical protein
MTRNAYDVWNRISSDLVLQTHIVRSGSSSSGVEVGLSGVTERCEETKTG